MLLEWSTMVPMHETARSAIERGIDFLLAGQSSDGLWRDFRTPAGEASTWPTGYIGNTLQLAGVDRTALEQAARALVQRQQPDGGWGYNEDTPSDADSTSWALLFLSGMRGHDRACDRAGASLARHQRRHTGGVATYAEAGPIRRFVGLGRWVPFRGWCRPHVEVSAHRRSPNRSIRSLRSRLRTSQRSWRAAPRCSTRKRSPG
jgi:Prenyltransferase and squalene oxidase repeat